MLLPGASFAADPTWDQGRMTKLAEELYESSSDLYTTLYKDQGAMGRFGGGDASHDFKDTVRILHSETGHLKAELEKGKGRAETRPVIKRLLELNDDLQVSGQRFDPQDDALGGFAKFEDILHRIAPYYGLNVDRKGSK